MRPRYVAASVAVLVIVAIFAYSLILDRLATDENRIRTVINTIVDSAEKRNLRKISGCLHADFREEELDLDRRTTIDIMGRLFLTYPVIRAEVQGVNVKIIDEATAEARFIGSASAARSPDSPGEELLRYRRSDRFLITFKKENGKWRIIRSRAARSTAD